MRKEFNKAMLMVVGMGFVVSAWAQTPKEEPAPVPQPVPQQAAGQQTDWAGASGSQQAKSQPGAEGQATPETKPAVSVPAGPVPPHDIKPAPPTPIAMKKEELGSEDNWNPQWDVLIEENLPAELMSPRMAKGVRPFCPRFGQLSEGNKRAFWAYVFQALAGAEAGLKPTADVKHLDPTVDVRDTVSQRTVRQEGLLQLTYEDSDRYGCNFDWEKDKDLPKGDPGKTILQPKNNLLCGLRILKNQMIDRNKRC